METSETRAKIYEVLSECFKEPVAEFAADVQSGRIQEFLADAFQRFGIEDSSSRPCRAGCRNVRKPDRWDWETLVHPFRHLVPVQSVYGPTGCLMGGAGREMAALYKEAGVTPPSEYAAMPDRLCLLLEFMSMLCREGTSEVQREFLERHLLWVEKLKEDSIQHDGSPVLSCSYRDSGRSCS